MPWKTGWASGSKGLKPRLKEEIPSVENRLNLRVNGVTQDIRSAESRLSDRIDRRETEPKPEAEAV